MSTLLTQCSDVFLFNGNKGCNKQSTCYINMPWTIDKAPFLTKNCCSQHMYVACALWIATYLRRQLDWFSLYMALIKNYSRLSDIAPNVHHSTKNTQGLFQIYSLSLHLVCDIQTTLVSLKVKVKPTFFLRRSDSQISQ